MASYTRQASFYTIGGALSTDAPSYVQRQADMDLHTAVVQGKYCYILTSRQMGKSSLVMHTADRLRKEDSLAVAVLDLTAIGQNLTVEQWYYGLLAHIGEDLDLEDELEDFWLRHERLGPLQRWMTAIRDVVLVKCKGQVVIFIDEIDVVRSLKFSTDEFFAAIREFYNRRTEDPELNRLSFCLVGVATPTDLIQDRRLTPFNIGQRIELTDFTEAEAAPLARGLGRAEKLGQALVNRILYWTGGHPYLTQRLCQAVAEDQSMDGNNGVDRLCDSLFLSSHRRDEDSNLVFVSDRILRSDADRGELLELYWQVRRRRLYGVVRQRSMVRDDDTNPLINTLRLSGITRSINGYLYVRNRIYARVFDAKWVQANMPDAELREQVQRLRAAIRKGRMQAFGLASVLLFFLAGLLVYSRAETRRANENAKQLVAALDEANTQRQFALEQTKLAEEQRGKAEKLQHLAVEQKNIAERQKQIAEEQRSKAEKLQQNAEEQKTIVEAQKKEAENQRQIAEEQRRLADQQRQLALQKGQEAQQSAEENKRLAEDNKRLANDLKGELGRQELLQGDNQRALAYLSNAYQEADQMFRTQKPYLQFLLGRASRSLDGQNASLNDHTGTVFSAAFSKDGRWIVTASEDRTARIWETATGKLHHILKSHGLSVLSAAFSADSKFVVTASEDMTAKLWEVETGKELRTFSGHKGPVIRAFFGPDETSIITISKDRTLKVWEIATGKERFTCSGTNRNKLTIAEAPPVLREILHTLPLKKGEKASALFEADQDEDEYKYPILSEKNNRKKAMANIAVSPEGNFVFPTSQSNARTCDVAVGQKFSILNNSGNVEYANLLNTRTQRSALDTSASFSCSPDGSRIIGYCGLDSRIIACSPNGNRIVTSSEDGTATIWDVTTGETLTILKRSGNYPERFLRKQPSVLHAAFSPDGTKVVTANEDSLALVWDVSTRRIISTLLGHEDSVYYAEFSPDGRFVVTASNDKTAKVWEAETGKQLASLDGHRDQIKMAVFSPDSQLIVTTSIDRTAKIWNWHAASKPAAVPFKSDKGAASLWSTISSPDGKRVLTPGEDETAKLWNAETGELITTLSGHHKKLNRAVFSPDGRWVATASDDKTANVWNAETGELLHTLAGHEREVFYISFSPDSRTLLTFSEDKTAKLWDIKSGKPLHDLVGFNDRVHFAAFSADGSQVVTAGEDKLVKIWKASNGVLLHTLEGHQSLINSAIFSRDGKLVVTAGLDGTAKIWDAKAGELLRTLDEQTAAIYYAEFSPDGQFVITANQDNSAKLWDMKSGQMLHSLDEHQGAVRYAAFSPDGKFIVTASVDKTAKIWDAGTGKLLGTLNHTNGVYKAQFSRDGNHIMTVSEDKSARVWDVHLEQRSPEQVADLVKRFVPYHFEGSELLPNTSNRGAGGNGATPHR